MQLVALSVTAAITFLGSSVDTYAASNSSKVTSVMPQAGITYALGNNQVSLSNLQQSVDTQKSQSDNSSTNNTSGDGVDLSNAVTDVTPRASTVTDNVLSDIQNATGAVIKKSADSASAEDSSEPSEEEMFKSLVIAKVTNYVNVRDLPSEEGEIVGKLYDKSVGTFIEEKDGWYKIQSGSVEGYVKAEFCVTGDDAVELAKKVGTRIATVTTTTLKVRDGAGLDAAVIGLVPIEDELVVTEELDGWVKVSIEEGDGYVSTDYVTLSTEFVKAESKAEEEARLAKEAAARAAANKAAQKGTSSSSSSSGSSYNSASSYTTQTSSIGSAVAQFALQFVGNPYVYGGTSLTNGADCSGFVMSVYANFGVSLPHSSGADRGVGAAVDGLANAQPGDIVCYSGHVAIYIGNGQIVHASTAKTGIKVSNADYRSVLAVRRIF